MPADVTFSSGETEEEIVFTANADGIDDGGESVRLTIASSLPPGVDRGTPYEATVSIANSDMAGLVLSESTLTVVEGATTGRSYTVKLSTQPTGPVTVEVSGRESTALRLSTTTLSFSTQGWNTPQTVEVTAVDDANAVDESETLTHTASGGEYGGVSAGLSVTVTDDDTPGLVLSTSTLSVVEGDAVGASYTVRLSHEPTETMTVEISGHGGTDLRLSATTLSYSPDTWNTPQTVGVTAVDDADPDDDTETLTHTASGGEYGGVSVDLGVTVTDDAPESVTVSFERDTYTVMEGSTETVTVIMSEDPEREVTVSITRTDLNGATSTDYSVVPASVTFTSGDTEKEIVFTANADGIDDSGESVRLTIASSLPSGVDRGTPYEATVSIANSDKAGLVLSESSLTVVEGATTGRSYTVRLSTQPTQSVTVEVSGHEGTALRLSTTTLSFSTQGWNTPQTVEVTAVDDANAVDESETLTHTASGGEYAGVSTGLAVTVTDDAPVSVSVSFERSSYTVDEGATTSIQVILSEDPEREVTVSITMTDLGGATSTDYSGVPASVIFPIGQTSKSFIFTATQDSEDEDNESVLLAFGTLPPAVSPGMNAQATVSINDDDDPMVTVSFEQASYRVLEGDAVMVGVTLSEDPKRTVVIPLVDSGEGGASSADYSGVPPSVTIREGETSKTFEFVAMADDDSDPDESVMIAFGTSLPSRVTEGIPKEARVSINQMSRQLVPGVTVSFGQAAYTVSEGDMVTVTVDLSADPGRNITIPITATSQDGASSADYSGVPESLTFNSGQTSKSFEFMATADSGPPAPVDGTAPTNLRTYERDQSLRVSWSRPAVRDPSAPVTSYLMRSRQVGASGWQNEPLDDDSGWHTISGLTNRRHYEVQVAAVTRLGTGAWASAKGTPQASSPAAAPGPVGDEAFNVGHPKLWWDEANSRGSYDNIMRVPRCTGTKSFTVIWADPNAGSGPDVHRGADEWAAHIDTRGGAGTVTYSFRESPGQRNYYEMNGTVNFEGPGSLSLRVRGRFDSTWGTWSSTVSLYCSGETDENVEISFGTLPSEVTEGTPNVATVTIREVSAGFSRAVGGTESKGEPRIDGIPEVGQTLSADTTGNTDADGLENGVFRYQWLAEDTDIAGAIGSTYTLTSGDVGKAIRVKVTFTDDGGNEETLTSMPTVVTAGLQLQSATVDGATLTLTYDEDLDTGVTLELTARVSGEPSSHDGQDAFTFELRFSEEPRSDFSYTTVRDHAFTVTGGSVTHVRQLEPGSNIGWEITLTPETSADVVIALNATTDCYAQGAICTEDGGKLSGGLQLVVPGPNTPAAGLLSITGTAQEGETLTADTSGIEAAEGLDNVTFNYQWLADGDEITGATGDS